MNYIYQSHLGGEDNGQQPQWVQDATAKIENGELVDQVIDVLVQDIASLLDTVLDNLTVTEVLGITGWDNNEGVKNFIAAEGRTPLLSPYKGHNNTETTLALIFGPLGAGWTSSNNTFTVPSADYTLGQFLDDFNDSFAGALYTIDLGAMLDELINGTPADPEEGTEATEGLITEEIRNQLGGWLLSLVNSMGTDSNHPQDNNTEISVQWKLLTDRTALDAAIEKAERLDLSQYTEASAKAVKDALTMAKSLPKTASQDEMNTAAKNLEDAMAALQTVENSQPENSESDNSQKPDIDNPQNSDETESNAQTSGNEVPQTGENHNAIPLIVPLVSGGCVVLLMAAKKIRIKAQ